MNASCQHCGCPFTKRHSGSRFCSKRCAGAAQAAAKRAAGEPEQRFWSRVKRLGEEDCWPWLASTSEGYGQIRFCGRKVGAHVLSFELANGPVSAGRMVLHACGNRLCCNPAHLYAGNHADNTNDAVQHGTHKCNFGQGDQHIGSRLREAYIPLIRDALQGGESQCSVARRFGVSQQAVSNVARGSTWKHVA